MADRIAPCLLSQACPAMSALGAHMGVAKAVNAPQILHFIVDSFLMRP